MATVVDIPAPNEKQKLFFGATSRYVAYGGARGGGKSWAVRVKAGLMAAKYPGIRQLILRRTYPELWNNHIKPMREMYPAPAATYNDKNKEMRFANGSVIVFGYCGTDSDVLRYQGQEYDIIYIDEGTQFKEEWFHDLNACVRGVNCFPKRTYVTCNPGGVGHAWVKRLFVDRAYQKGERPEDYTFIQAKVQDNTALMDSDPEYVQNLMDLPPARRAAWLDGRWDVYEGQFFSEFRDDPDHYEDHLWTHVIAPFDIPQDWTIYRSFDWGYSRPFSCGWWAVDYDGVAYRILELYGCTENPNEGLKWTAPQVFAEIHRIEAEHRWLRGKRIHGVADPAIWSADGGESINDVALRNQVYFQRGDHQRIPGWMQMHYRMAFDENGRSMMYIFRSCSAAIRTLPLLQYDEHKVEDLDTDGEDHIADESRYFCMARPIKPRRAAVRDPYVDSPQNIFLDIPKEDIMPRRRIPRTEVIEHG